MVARLLTERRKTEQVLKDRETELKDRAVSLEEMNTALKVLLQKRDDDKVEFEEKVMRNVNELVTPFLEKLKLSRLDKNQMAYISIIESNLNDIISSFSHKFSFLYPSLTPSEIHIASLIKKGK